MALRKLAGPFAIVDENGNPPSSLGAPICWVPYMGIALPARTPNWFGTGMLSLDGVVLSFADSTDAAYGWDVLNSTIVAISATSGIVGEYVRDPRCFLGYLVDPTSDLGLATNSYAKLPDRRLKSDGATIVAVVNGVGTVEYSGFGLPNVGAHVSAGRADAEIFVAADPDAGIIAGRFYDTAAKQPSSSIVYISGLGSDSRAVYARDLGVIVVVDLDGLTVSAFSLETLPASLGDPALASGRNQGGVVATYRSQALGDQGEPCIGELVDWAIASGDGELLDTQSATDAQGYAAARVAYGLADGGSTVLTAELRC